MKRFSCAARTPCSCAARTPCSCAARTLFTDAARTLWVRGIIITIALAFATSASAQDGTIEQLVATALERSPEIRAARTETAAAAGQLTQAGLRPNPSVSGSQMQMTGSQNQTLVGIEWPLELFRRASRVAVAQQNVQATTLSIQDRERTLAAAVRGQAGRLLAARRTVEVMNEALTAARRMRELLDSRVSEGDTPKIDANIAAVELGRMEADLLFAQADADGAAIELKALVGFAPTEQLLLRDSLETLVRVDAVAPAMTQPAAEASQAGQPAEGAPMPQGMTMAAAQSDEAMLAARPDIREAAARVALADARVTEARNNGRVDLMLSGNYGHEHYGFAQRGFDAAGGLAPIEGSFHSVTFGATLMLPVRNKNQGALAYAEAEHSGEQERLAARQLEARAELDAAMVRDREARRAVEMYATNVRDLARQNVDVELEAYDLGRTSLSDVLGEQRRYLDIEASYTSALSRAYDARVSLRRARGEIR